MTEFTAVTATDRPDLRAAANATFRERWPEFILHDPLHDAYMPRAERHFARYSIYLLRDGAVAAGAWAVALDWDGTREGLPEGYRTALASAVEDHEAGLAPNTLSFMGAAVSPGDDGRGMAARVLTAVIERAVADGLDHVIAPIRPTLKHRYPQVPMAEYATWRRSDGQALDPWIRTHERMGAEILGPAPDSLIVAASVSDWERWADMAFPVSGAYVVPEALNLVEVDRGADRAVYREENLWVRHR